MVRIVETGRARVACREWGHGPPLVALHAGVADGRVWEECARRWAADGWRVVAPDRRGFGESTWEAEEFSHVDDLLAVMDALGLPSAVLVGNSQGGRVTIEAAAEAGDLDTANRLEAHLWLDGPLQPEGRVTGSARELFLEMNGRALGAPDVGSAQWDDTAWGRLGELQAPTVVVAGDLDEAPHLTVGVAEAIPGADLVRMPSSAHLPMLDDPEAFAAAVAPHLARWR